MSARGGRGGGGARGGGGNKRSFTGGRGGARSGGNGGAVVPALPRTQFTATFEAFALEFDAVNATREEVYKLSRDITAASKRVISLLQRMSLTTDDATFLTGARSEIRNVHAQMRDLTKLLARTYSDLAPASTTATIAARAAAAEDKPLLPLYWEFYKRFNFCLQEYVEAFTFYHFLKHHALCEQEHIAAAIAEDFAALDEEETAANQQAAAAEAEAEAAAAKAEAEAEAAAEAKAAAATSSSGVAGETEDGTMAAAGTAENLAQLMLDGPVPSAIFPSNSNRNSNSNDSNKTAIATTAAFAMPAVVTPVLPIPPADYLLGLFDLTGELMRFGLTVAPRSPAFAAQIATFIAALSLHLGGAVALHSDALQLRRKDTEGKTQTLKDSLSKLEEVCYSWKKQTAEFSPEVVREALERMVQARAAGTVDGGEGDAGGAEGANEY